MKINKQRLLLRTAISEPDGKISSSRIIAISLTLFYVITAAITFITTHRLPDIPTNLMILIMGLYGINKVGSTVSSFNQRFSGRP